MRLLPKTKQNKVKVRKKDESTEPVSEWKVDGEWKWVRCHRSAAHKWELGERLMRKPAG